MIFYFCYKCSRLPQITKVVMQVLLLTRYTLNEFLEFLLHYLADNGDLSKTRTDTRLAKLRAGGQGQ